MSTGEFPEAHRAIAEAAATAVPAALGDLGALVRIPGIAWPTFDPDLLVRSAEAVADLARGTGLFDDVHVLRAAIPGTDQVGQPAVLAHRAARAGAPTVLLYAHHDVQPPGDESLWDSPPFEPTLRDGRIYARGAADDKAGIMTHIAALRALREVHGADIDLGIVLFVEGEEEYGSPSFGQFLADHRDLLRADVIIVADSGNWDTATPALTVSLRGNVRFTLTVRTLTHASHSGMYGGAVPDAMLAAIKLLATLWDDDGAVAVEGLVARDTPTPEYSDETLRDEAGLLPGTRPIGRGPILSRIWNQPAITVTGVGFTTIEAASNTLSPAASFVISARVAPGQSARDAFDAIRAHLRAHAPFGAELVFGEVDHGDGFLVDTSGWAVDAIRTALTDGYGIAPLETGVGGSIPFISDLAREFPESQILVTGIEDPHSRAHSPNESLHVDTFRHAIAAEALFLDALVTDPDPASRG